MLNTHKNDVYIAVIDDGINEELYNIGELVHNVEVNSDLTIVERRNYDRYLNSHGTNCAAIIKNYAPYCNLSSVKVLGENLKTTKNQLVTAIRWCIEDSIKIINMSLGTIDYGDFEDLKQIVNKAYTEGVIIIAACNNDNIITFPASLTNVIGVKRDVYNKCREGEYLYNVQAVDGIEVEGCACDKIIRYDGVYNHLIKCNSYTAPMITALVYNMITDNPKISLEGIKLKLREGSINQYNVQKELNVYSRWIDWADKAIVFNTDGKFKISSKNSLITLSYIVQMNFYNIEETLKDIINHCNNNKNILENIDTIIILLSDTNEKNETENFNEILYDFLVFLKSIGKNVIFIDDKWKEKNITINSLDWSIKIWSPDIPKKNTSISSYDNNLTTKQNINLPMIMVLGESKGEVLDLLYNLRRYFYKDGYRALVCTDTSKGIIYGFEYVPIMQLNDLENLDIINNLCRAYEADIIIMGITNYEKEQVRYVDKYYEFDIRIVFDSKGKDNCLLINNWCKSIILTRGTNKKSGIETFDTLDTKWENKLYSHILKLYENC